MERCLQHRLDDDDDVLHIWQLFMYRLDYDDILHTWQFMYRLRDDDILNMAVVKMFAAKVND